jgi:calcineurin-like phosphoesterase family protein
MTIYFTSDLHLGHLRINELADRPFSSVDEMNWEIVERWNSVVLPSDCVYVLGDLAMGSISESLEIAAQLRGYKILVPGNHDRCFRRYRKGGPRLSDWEMYTRVGFAVYNELEKFISINLSRAAEVWLLSHFPYSGDSGDVDRYANCRPKDEGDILIHGHTHSKEKGSGREVHVGVDAWDFYPVREDEIVSELNRRGL